MTTHSENIGADKLSSEELATLIVDALLHEKIVAESDVVRAIEIATEEISVRKVLNDY